LFDIISHDIGNYHQIIQNILEIVTSLFKKNSNNITSLSQESEKIITFLTTAKKALTKSQSLVDNIRRLERLYAQKDPLLILKNLPDVLIMHTLQWSKHYMIVIRKAKELNFR
jgi:hypothetical protein